MTINRIESTGAENTPSLKPEVYIPEEILVLAERVRSYVSKEEKPFSQRVISGINLFQKKVSDYGTILALQDTAHSAFRAGVGLVKYLIKDDQTLDALDVASRVSSVVSGSFNTLTKGIELKKAVEKLKPAFKYGDVIDKLDSLIAFIRTLVNFLSATGGFATSAAGKSAFSIAMKIPQLLLKFVSYFIWICRATGRITRILIGLIAIGKAQGQPNEKLRLLMAIKGFKEASAKIDAFDAVAQEMHGESEELKDFLKERKTLKLSQEFGAYAEKKIFSKFEGQTTFDMMESDLNKLEVLKRGKTGDELLALQEQESALIATGLGWIEEIRTEMKKNIFDTAPILTASILAISSMVVGLLVFPHSELISAILTIIALAAGTLFAGLGLLRTWEVQENQKEWIKKIMIRHLMDEARAAQDTKAFMVTYGYVNENDNLIEFKKYLKERVDKLHPIISLKFIEILKKYNQTVSSNKIASVEELTGIRDQFAKLFDALVVNDKQRISRERKLLPFIEGLANSRHLKAFGANFSRTFYKQHKIIVES